MLGVGESPAWVAQQLGHTSAEMVVRRYAKFIPNHPTGRLKRQVAGSRGKARDATGQAASDPWVTENARGLTGCPVRPCQIGAADRIRTGDVQLGKLAFCH